LVQANDNTYVLRRMLGSDWKALIACDLLKKRFTYWYCCKGFHSVHLYFWKYNNHSGAYEYPNEFYRYFVKKKCCFLYSMSFWKNPFTSESIFYFHKKILM
jgi:hypothetical protein